MIGKELMDALLEVTLNENDVEFERDVSELKKDLRYTFKYFALNSFGKKVVELNKNELKRLLELVFDHFSPFYRGIRMGLYVRVFKEVFSKQIKVVKE